MPSDFQLRTHDILRNAPIGGSYLGINDPVYGMRESELVMYQPLGCENDRGCGWYSLTLTSIAMLLFIPSIGETIVSDILAGDYLASRTSLVNSATYEIHKITRNETVDRFNRELYGRLRALASNSSWGPANNYNSQLTSSARMEPRLRTSHLGAASMQPPVQEHRDFLRAGQPNPVAHWMLGLPWAPEPTSQPLGSPNYGVVDTSPQSAPESPASSPEGAFLENP